MFSFIYKRKSWKQLMVASNKQLMVNKLWHIQTIKYYSVLKGNELLSHEQTEET